jgi:hypothetical protein
LVFLLGLADAELAALTVIVGAVAVAVRVVLPSATVTVARYVTVSPAVAVFGTVSWVSTWGWAGLAIGTLRLQVVPLVLEQVSTVNTGAANAGVVLLGVSVDVILPVALAFRFVYAEIRNRIVAPGSTLVADDVTAMSATGLGVALVEGVGVGVAELVPVALAEGVGVAEVVALIVLGVLLAEADGEALAVEDGEALAVETAADGELLAEADGVLVALVAVGDGVVAAMAVPVTPLARTKRPVARPTVTGLECADRMKTPCLSWLSRLENVLSGTLFASGVSRCLSVEDAPIRHQHRHSTPPLLHNSPQFAPAPSPSVTSARSAGLVVARPNSPTISLPRSVPLYARLSKRKPDCAHLNHLVTRAP